MVNIKDLQESDKGRNVVYKQPHSALPIESGYITSWNDTYIFVCFDKSGRGQAVAPSKLDFEHS